MRVLTQRVLSAKVTVETDLVGSIGKGLLLLVGIHRDDILASDGDALIKKILSVRLFEDDDGKMGRSVADIQGEILVVSQFTLYGETNKGTRPDFSAAMPATFAKPYFEEWVKQLRFATTLKVAEGRFGANMQVELVNDGPVTLMLESRKHPASTAI